MVIGRDTLFFIHNSLNIGKIVVYTIIIHWFNRFLYDITIYNIRHSLIRTTSYKTKYYCGYKYINSHYLLLIFFTALLYCSKDMD